VSESGQNGVRLVVGATGGIGLALVEAQLADPQVAQVIATYRPGSNLSDLNELADVHGTRLRRIPLEVTEQASIDSLENQLGRLRDGVDVAIHATGILHENEIQPEKSVSECTARNLMRLFQVNSVAPLMVARALLATQSRRREFRFAALSAMVGSIGDNRLGGWYGYRASKAALNQLVRTLALECRMKFPGATILALHPGTTDTRLSRPFQRNVQPERLYTPQRTAARLLRVIEQATPAQSGSFLNWDGSEIPW